MEIVSVRKRAIEGGIELADLNSVKSALKSFMDGNTPGSRESTRHGFEGSVGGVGLMLKTLVDSKHESAFMQDLLKDVDQVTEKRGMHRSYDYDGIGPFFKTSVEVKKIKLGRRKFVYLLGLNAAYVGDKPCAGLAEALGANRALNRIEVNIELSPVGDRFEVDFHDIVQRFAQIGLTTAVNSDGEQLAYYFMTQAKCEGDRSPHTLLRDDEIAASFGISTYTVGGPWTYGAGETDFVWSRDGAVISGPLSRYPDQKPELYVSIEMPTDPKVSSWNRPPVLSPTLKQAMHDQADSIVTAFS